MPSPMNVLRDLPKGSSSRAASPHGLQEQEPDREPLLVHAPHSEPRQESLDQPLSGLVLPLRNEDLSEVQREDRQLMRVGRALEVVLKAQEDRLGGGGDLQGCGKSSLRANEVGLGSTSR